MSLSPCAQLVSSTTFTPFLVRNLRFISHTLLIQFAVGISGVRKKHDREHHVCVLVLDGAKIELRALYLLSGLPMLLNPYPR